MRKKSDVLIGTIVFSLVVVSLFGVLSIFHENAYDIENQYGDLVTIWGGGVYAHDSFFKTPIFIGTDLIVLLLVVPMLIYRWLTLRKKDAIKRKLSLLSILAVCLYYATSIAFGVTYNKLHLPYILLFGICFFTFIFEFIHISKFSMKMNDQFMTKGLKIFLWLSGISLFVAWLPDIVTSLVKDQSLALIEVYTTEITYVLDMGIISPLIFICMSQLKKNMTSGVILLAVILKTCAIIGLMVISQTLFQVLVGILVPMPVLVTKVGIFVILAAFAKYYEIKLYENLIL